MNLTIISSSSNSINTTEFLRPSELQTGTFSLSYAHQNHTDAPEMRPQALHACFYSPQDVKQNCGSAWESPGLQFLLISTSTDTGTAALE